MNGCTPHLVGVGDNRIGKVHWNAVYMQEALNQLTANGTEIDAVDFARLSPISWRHINFLGRYEFSLPESVTRGELSPLRDPSSEHDL